MATSFRCFVELLKKAIPTSVWRADGESREGAVYAALAQSDEKPLDRRSYRECDCPLAHIQRCRSPSDTRPPQGYTGYRMASATTGL